MFGRNHFETHFSVMLAEEILRAELEKHFDGRIHVFQRVIEPGKVKNNSACNGTATKVEMDHRYGNIWERTVTFELIVGPRRAVETPALTPLGPIKVRWEPTPLMRIEAECRVFSAKHRTDKSKEWRPHYLTIRVINENGKVEHHLVFWYEEGWVENSVFVQSQAKTAENPCPELISNQLSVVCPRIAPSLHKRREVVTGII